MKRLFYLIFVAALLAGCSIKTPEIQGVVLDEETKKPVEGTWISSTLSIKTKTIGGDVSSYLTVDSPHTRTDKEGKFVIPSKRFDKPSIPAGFGTNIESFSINASTIDDKSGGFYIEDFKGKRKIEVVVYVKPWEKGLSEEREYFSYIQSLYNYCISGRFGVEVPAVKSGCDDWELNYAITKHERYMERLGEPDPKSDRGGHYTGTLNQLGYLLKKRGNYRESLDALKKLKEFSTKRKTESLYTYEFDVVMPELEQLLKEKQK